jgi:hypothetical protein
MKELLTALVIIVSIGATDPVCAQDFKKGLGAAKRGDFASSDPSQPEVNRPLGVASKRSLRGLS